MSALCKYTHNLWAPYSIIKDSQFGHMEKPNSSFVGQKCWAQQFFTPNSLKLLVLEPIFLFCWSHFFSFWPTNEKKSDQHQQFRTVGRTFLLGRTVLAQQKRKRCTGEMLFDYDMTNILVKYFPNNVDNSFQKWLRILFRLIIPMNFQILLPVSYQLYCRSWKIGNMKQGLKIHWNSRKEF